MGTSYDIYLSDLAISRPGATRVLRGYGLDFCCHGGRPLSDACEEKGIDPESVLREIEAVGKEVTITDWYARPIGELVDYIVQRYHNRLRHDLPELERLAGDVDRAHAEHPRRPVGLPQLLADIHAAVLSHLAKEEEILFPMIKRGEGAHAAAPIRVMESEHDDHGANLARLRELTDDLRAPDDACPTWRALYRELDRLEQELMEHIHLENNVLFPRALGA